MSDWLRKPDPSNSWRFFSNVEDCEHENLVSTTKVDECQDCGGWFVYP